MRCVGCYFSPGLIRVVTGRWAGTYYQSCFVQLRTLALRLQQRS